MRLPIIIHANVQDYPPELPMVIPTYAHDYHDYPHLYPELPVIIPAYLRLSQITYDYPGLSYFI